MDLDRRRKGKSSRRKRKREDDEEARCSTHRLVQVEDYMIYNPPVVVVLVPVLDVVAGRRSVGSFSVLDRGAFARRPDAPA